jgi:hypothetical protein
VVALLKTIEVCLRSKPEDRRLLSHVGFPLHSGIWGSHQNRPVPYSSSTTRPSRNVTRRSMRAASSALWVQENVNWSLIRIRALRSTPVHTPHTRKSPISPRIPPG